MRRILLLLSALLAPPALGQQAPLPPDLGARVAAAYVEPAVAGFEAAATDLAADVEALCAAPSEAGLAAARDGFAGLVGAWGRLSVLRFGPLVSDNRFETIFFWPDPRGVTLRQVQAALAEDDPAVADPAHLAGKSVALQNLLALEYLLAGTDAALLAQGEDAHRCRYAHAAALVLRDQARAVAAGWSGAAPIGASFRHPGPDGYFRTPREVLGELVKAWLTTVDYVRSAELLPPMGESIAAARGRRAPLWRSDLTFTLIGAQLAGLIDLLDATGLGGTLTGAAATPFNNLRSDLVRAAHALAAIDAPAEAAFADPAIRSRLDYAALLLGYASTTIGGDLTAALGLTMGFNALDGD